MYSTEWKRESVKREVGGGGGPCDVLRSEIASVCIILNKESEGRGGERSAFFSPQQQNGREERCRVR